MSNFSAPPPNRFSDVLEWFDPSQVPEEVSERVDRIVEGSPQGFSLLGPPGTGKTTTACWAAEGVRHVAELGPDDVGYVTSLKYQHALQERISIEKMTPSAGENADSFFFRYEGITGWTRWLRAKCPLLIFDDWGKEHTTHSGFIEDEIEFLLRDRFDNDLCTILTSNMGLTSIKSRFGESMASFIHEAFPPIVLTGDDRRRS